MKRDLKERILLGLTGWNFKEVKDKVIEANRLNLRRISLFLEFLNIDERFQIYSLLMSSNRWEIPLVHIKNDMTLEELNFLKEKFNSKYFTIHENSFEYLKNWKGHEKNLVLEFNYDDFIPNNVNIKKIGGFCIDLSHFMASVERKTKESDYILKFKNSKNLFIANHLNGYSKKFKKDLHWVKSVKELDYLRDIPKFIFGDLISLEVFNSIHEQIFFKKYLIKFLRGYV